MSFHDLFFGIVVIIYDLILSGAGGLALVIFVGYQLKLIEENGWRNIWRNSSKHLLMIAGAIALLVMIVPESYKKTARDNARNAAYYKAHPDEEEPDPADYSE